MKISRGIWAAAIALTLHCSTSVATAEPVPTSMPAASTQPNSSDAPYVQALRMVKELSHGPDAELIDANAPLDARTAKFLDNASPIFELIHMGAAMHSTDCGIGAGKSVDIQKLMGQLNCVRQLANLESLRARQRYSLHDPSHAQDDLLDAMTMSRNIAHDYPVLVVVLVEIGIEHMALTQWARELPATPSDRLAAIPERLKQLPAAPSMADVIEAEHSFAINASNTPPDITAGMKPFYDSVAAALKQEPMPSPAAFQQMLTDGGAALDPANTQGRQLVEILAASFGPAYVTMLSVRVNELEFEAGLTVIRDGRNAIDRSIDPFGKGPFRHDWLANGFQLSSALLRNGKPVTLDFGSDE